MNALPFDPMALLDNVADVLADRVLERIGPKLSASQASPVAEFATPDEMAGIIKVSRSTLDRMRKTGRVKPIAVGTRDFRYHVSDTIAALQQQDPVGE